MIIKISSIKWLISWFKEIGELSYLVYLEE